MGPNSLPIPAVPDPNKMTQAQKVQYGIEEIPISQAKAQAVRLGLSLDNIDKLQESGQSVVYLIHNPFGLSNNEQTK